MFPFNIGLIYGSYFCGLMEKMNDLLKRVYDLFVKYGIKSVTMDDVSRELGISKKTLYNFVNDKSDLVEKVMDFEQEKNKECYLKLEKSGKNAIEELFEVHKFLGGQMKHYSYSLAYDLKKYYPEIFQRIHKIQREHMRDAILENIRKGKKEGLYRKELQEEIIVKLQVSRIESLYEDQLFTIEDFTSGKIFREFFIYHIRGIANEKGVAYLEEHLNKLNL